MLDNFLSYTFFPDRIVYMLKVPSLNDSPLHELRANSVVRFRCMVQDMFDPEFYLGVYEVADLESGKTSLKSGKYRDIAQCGVSLSSAVTNENVVSSRVDDGEGERLYTVSSLCKELSLMLLELVNSFSAKTVRHLSWYSKTVCYFDT